MTKAKKIGIIFGIIIAGIGLAAISPYFYNTSIDEAAPGSGSMDVSDLYVYLSTDEGASDYVSLGTLKANMGNQNYEIPSDVDVAKYSKVLIWCQAFSVLFGSADLA